MTDQNWICGSQKNCSVMGKNGQLLMCLLRPQQPGQFNRMHGIMERSKPPVLPAITDVDSEPLPLGLLAGPHGLLPRHGNQWSLGHIEVSTLPLLIPSSSLYGCVDPLLLQCGPWSWPGQWHSCHLLLATITGMRWLDFSMSLLKWAEMHFFHLF